MSRWVDIRVKAEDGQLVLAAITQALEPVTMSIDMRPKGDPASHQISVQDKPEQLIAAVLDGLGVPHDLSTRLGPEYRPPPAAETVRPSSN